MRARDRPGALAHGPECQNLKIFAIDTYGDLTPVATSNSIGVAAFNGVAFSQ